MSILATEFRMADAAKVWKKEGKEKGREEALVEIANRMLAKNIAIQDIVEVTGLSAEQVTRLRA